MGDSRTRNEYPRWRQPPRNMTRDQKEHLRKATHGAGCTHRQVQYSQYELQRERRIHSLAHVAQLNEPHDELLKLLKNMVCPTPFADACELCTIAVAHTNKAGKLALGVTTIVVGHYHSVHSASEWVSGSDANNLVGKRHGGFIRLDKAQVWPSSWIKLVSWWTALSPTDSWTGYFRVTADPRATPVRVITPAKVPKAYPLKLPESREKPYQSPEIIEAPAEEPTAIRPCDLVKDAGSRKRKQSSPEYTSRLKRPQTDSDHTISPAPTDSSVPYRRSLD